MGTLLQTRRGSERRRETRQSLPLPVAVEGFALGENWEEGTTTYDTCSGGVSFLLQRPVRKGQVLRLRMPFPKTLRRFDHFEPLYTVYAIVRNVLADDRGLRVGVTFFGQQPPTGFDRNPGARFLLRSDIVEESREETPRRLESSGPDSKPEIGGRRVFERFEVFVEFTVRVEDEWGSVLFEEATVSENLSLGGARLRASRAFQRGEVVWLQEAAGRFEAAAEVVNASVGPDQVARLHVKFLRGRQPTHLLPSH